MRIAQIAPLWVRVPPKGYGGAELIISLLTEELVKRGHDVTLFASKDSVTRARLVSVSQKALGMSPKTDAETICDNTKDLFNIFLAAEQSKDFDLLHWHITKTFAPLMCANVIGKPSVVTFHNHFNDPEFNKILKHYRRAAYFISISDSHRKQFPLKFTATVYNAIDVKIFEFNDKPEKYFVWIGRFWDQKGPDLAIQIALRLRTKLKLAAPLQHLDKDTYFQKTIRPFLDNKYVEYVGEAGPRQRNKLLRDAFVFINPIRWEEPFGLVVPEANACGTPVIAFARGAMPELIKNGVNGFLVSPTEGVKGIIRCIKEMEGMPPDAYQKFRYRCREYAEEHFSPEKMVDGYEKIYQGILRSQRRLNSCRTPSRC